MILIERVLAFYLEKGNSPKTVDIAIQDDHIIEVGEDLSSRYSDAETIHGNGMMATPGLVCSHNHFYSALARGIMADIKPGTDFISVLQNLWWRLDRAIDEDILYSSGITAALDAITCGTTTVFDHHASPSFIKGSLSVLKNAFEKAGLRGVLCYETTDRNGPEGAEEGVRENVDFAGAVQGNSLIEASIGAHAPFTLGNRTLELLKEAVKETDRGLHIHTAEDAYDTSYSHGEFGMDIGARLKEFGLLDDKTICVHGLYLTEHDIGELNSAGAFLVHNPRSNMNNSVGYARRLFSIDNPGLGTDGIGSDMLEELKCGYFKHKDEHGPLWPGDFMKILWSGNNLASRYFGKKFGRIGKGYAADLVLWDYPSPTPLGSDNFGGHAVFGLSSRHVDTVIISGKPVYTGGTFPFETEDIYREARKQAQRLWDRMNALDT